MEFVLIVMASLTLVALIVTTVEFFFGFNKIKNLSQVSVIDSKSLPTVSVILSVLNEENNIESVIDSLMNLNYPHLEVIAINDRSTDQTPKILDNLQKKYSQLRVFHIDKLPEGWFGKNHALHFASQKANGEWLLFTDADVTMKNDTVQKTISYALKNKLDHLTVHEQHYRQPFWLKVSLLGYYLSYSLVMKPWLISYAWSKKSLGRGAFNLVKKQSYQQCGGHRAIAMECLDDLKLGELFKINGYRQDVVDGHDYVHFKWYGSLKQMIAGLEKNGFAFTNYQLIPALRDIFFGLIFFIWPVIAVFCFSGWVQFLNIFNVVITTFITAYVAHRYRLQKRLAILYPVAMGVLLYTVWNSVVKTYKNNGVIWRGTYYSLEKLKNRNQMGEQNPSLGIK